MVEWSSGLPGTDSGEWKRAVCPRCGGTSTGFLVSYKDSPFTILAISPTLAELDYGTR